MSSIDISWVKDLTPRLKSVEAKNSDFNVKNLSKSKEERKKEEKKELQSYQEKVGVKRGPQ